MTFSASAGEVFCNCIMTTRSTGNAAEFEEVSSIIELADSSYLKQSRG